MQKNLISSLEKALDESATEFAFIDFLDSINSRDELEEIAPELEKNGYPNLLEIYRKNLIKWETIELSGHFQEERPLLSAILDTPQKIRIFYRGAEFRKVSPFIMGDVFEDILLRKNNGEKQIIFNKCYGDEKCKALRIIYHQELEAATLIRLILPNSKITKKEERLTLEWTEENKE